MNSNWRYSPETPNLGQNRRFFLALWPCNLTYDLEKQYGTSSMLLQVHHFVAIGVFKLELQSENAQFGSKSTISLAVWSYNLTYDLENNRAPFRRNIKLYAFISSSHVNSNWSYSPETVKLGCDLCDLDLWPLTLTFCMDLTLAIGNNPWKFHDDTMMGT